MGGFGIDPAPYMVMILDVSTVTSPLDKAFTFKIFIEVFIKEMTHKFAQQVEKWKLNRCSRRMDFLSGPRCNSTG